VLNLGCAGGFMAEALPCEDAAFDAVVCVDVLEHVEDLDKVLREVARVLRPGARSTNSRLPQLVIRARSRKARVVRMRLASVCILASAASISPGAMPDPASRLRAA